MTDGMTIALVILGFSTAALAVWCWWLTRQIKQAADLLNVASQLIVKHSFLLLDHQNVTSAVSSRLDSVQKAVTVAITPAKR